MDHGAKNGTFQIDNNQVLSAAQLKGWLDEFETATNGRTSVVIVEACYSGSFVEALAGPHRMIITSSSQDQFSFFNNNGTVSFGQFFSNRLMTGETWEGSFDKAVADMSNIGGPYAVMNPQKSIGSEVTIGRVYGEFTMGSLFPEIKAYTQGVSVGANAAQSFNVQLGVMDVAGVEVWAMMTPPDYQPPTVSEEFVTPALNLDKITLASQDGTPNYSGSYTFPCSGTYSVTYYAKDSNGMVVASPPQTFDVTGEACGFVAQVNASWTLLSLPKTPADPAVDTVLGQIKGQLTSAWKWDNGNWAVYLPKLGATEFAAYISGKGFAALTTLDAGEGFWLNSDTEQSLNVTGAQAVDTSLSLSKGWNLVGLKGDSAQTVAALVAGHESQITSLWKWEGKGWTVNLPGDGDSGQGYAESKGFGHLTTIKLGEGFWVNATEALVLP